MDFTTTDENQVNTCQTSGHDTFSHENIHACEEYVRSIQRRLDRAVANDDRPKIRWYTHILAKKSRASKILAVHRICHVNAGRNTAGVDGVAMPKDRKERIPMMMEMIHSINIEASPKPIKRVFIPKPNGKLRPLGIPTLSDRINQEIIRQAIEPICEYHFQTCSYGFRPKRSCHDAIADLFNKLAKSQSKRWVIEGDIKGCFDHIKHDHIISTLKQWHIPNTATRIIEGFLKADIMTELMLSQSEEGTPQGGVISPMLANVALTCLDEEMRDKYGRTNNSYYRNSPMVRYADDFVIVAKTKADAENIKSHIKVSLKEKVGLSLSDEKTRITEISKGFDFLGFNLRKYGKPDTLLIKPSKEKVLQTKRKIKAIFCEFSDETPDLLIRKLSQITIGWSNYYRHVVSRSTFKSIDEYIWALTRRWIMRRHPHKRVNYWRRKYITRVRNDNWILYDERTQAKLSKLAWTPIKRFIKVRQDKRVYDVNAREYWEKREHLNVKGMFTASPTISSLYRQQRGRCRYCKRPITETQVKESAIHKHHLKPRSEGGDWKLSNLRLLHADCHNTLHGTFSRKEMADLINKGIDYLRLMKPAK